MNNDCVSHLYIVSNPCIKILLSMTCKYYNNISKSQIRPLYEAVKSRDAFSIIHTAGWYKILSSYQIGKVGSEYLLSVYTRYTICNWNNLMRGLYCINNTQIVTKNNQVNKSYLLAGASRGGHIDTVKQLLDITSTPNINHYNNRFNIFYGIHNINECFAKACAGGNSEIIEIMIYYGACDWNSGLYNACKNGDMNIIKYIIKLGATEWNRGLAGACRGGNIEAARFMIKKGAYDHSIGLMNACKSKSIPLIHYMLTLNPTVVNTGLVYSCQHNDVNLLNLFIEKGANNWDNGLFEACRTGQVNIAKFIINKGASNFDYGLIQACRIDHIELIMLMIECGAQNINEGFQIACDNNCMKAIELLIEIVDTDLMNKALISACTMNNILIAKTAIKLGANDFDLGLHYCNIKYTDLIKYLIECGINSFDDILENAISVLDYDLVHTILKNKPKLAKKCVSLACHKKDIKTIKVALSYRPKNINNEFVYACKEGLVEIVKLFILYGVKKLNAGLSVACSHKHKNIVKILIQQGATKCSCGNSIKRH